MMRALAGHANLPFEAPDGIRSSTSTATPATWPRRPARGRSTRLRRRHRSRPKCARSTASATAAVRLQSRFTLAGPGPCRSLQDYSVKPLCLFVLRGCSSSPPQLAEVSRTARLQPPPTTPAPGATATPSSSPRPHRPRARGRTSRGAAASRRRRRPRPSRCPRNCPRCSRRSTVRPLRKTDFEMMIKRHGARSGSDSRRPSRRGDSRHARPPDHVHACCRRKPRTRKVTATDAEVDDRLKQMQGQFPNEEAFKKALGERSMTLDRLRADTRDNLVISKMIDAEVSTTPGASDAEAKEFYEKNPDKFKQGETMRASHILIRVDEGADAATKQKAKARIEASSSGPRPARTSPSSRRRTPPTAALRRAGTSGSSRAARWCRPSTRRRSRSSPAKSAASSPPSSATTSSRRSSTRRPRRCRWRRSARA